MSRIGIFGGTFDPPHLGHLIVAETCADALDLSRVLWVPAADPPHKQDRGISAAQHRLIMVDVAIAGNGRFALSRVDVDRPGPHYSVDMVALIAEKYPDAALYFLMGGDSLRDLPTWHQPDRLIAQCQLGVIRRPGDRVDEIRPALYDALPALRGHLHVIDAPLIAISGSEIRQRVREGQSIRYRVPGAVAVYIAAGGLYR
jgi:nicotinate-nucleotide adenylyltransferase